MPFFFNRKNYYQSLGAKVEDLTSAIETLQKSIAQLDSAIAKSALDVVSKPPEARSLSIAIVGTRGHGQKHIDNFLKLKGCHISYICDVDTKVGKLSVEKVSKLQKVKPKLVQDFREALKDPKVDIVSISTPHHWHALATVWALKAGKHVYIEKPVTHSFDEAPSVMAAVKKYDRIVQCGTQLRSNTSLQVAGEFIRSGGIGKVEVVHCIIYKDRPNLPQLKENKVPATVNYDLWCGPRDRSDLTRSKFHYHWHWFWDFGNGALGNNGIHRIDVARIALDLKGYGDLVLSYGGRFGPSDKGETPNTQITIHKFDDTWVVQDVLGMKPKKFMGMENGVVFYGSKGTIVYTAGKARLVDKDFKDISVFEGKQLNHYYNFLEAIRRKDQSFARGDLEEGILSGELCHLGNASYRSGQKASDAEIDARVASIGAPKFIRDRLSVVRENMTSHGVKDEMMLGEVLKLRDTRNPIINNPKAAEFLKSKHRDGFVLPLPDDV